MLRELADDAAHHLEQGVAARLQVLEQPARFLQPAAQVAGILAGGAHFEYQPAKPAIISKVEQIKTIAQAFGVSVKGFVSLMRSRLLLSSISRALPRRTTK